MRKVRQAMIIFKTVSLAPALLTLAFSGWLVLGLAWLIHSNNKFNHYNALWHEAHARKDRESMRLYFAAEVKAHHDSFVLTPPWVIYRRWGVDHVLEVQREMESTSGN